MRARVLDTRARPFGRATAAVRLRRALERKRRTMLGAVAGVVGGYLVIALSVKTGLPAAYHLLEADVAFKHGTFEASR